MKTVLGDASLKNKKKMGENLKGGKCPISIWEFLKPRGALIFQKTIWIINCP